MDKKQFAERVANPVKFTSQERGWLHAMSAKYPHSSIVSAMALLADRAFHFDTPEERRAVALAVCDMGRIDSLINSVKPTVDEQPFDILNEINTFQEVSFKTAPKSVILSEFLENSGGMPPEMEDYDEVSVQDLAKKSIRPSDLLESETLALVLERQGKLAQAVSMYEKLIVNNPEKSSTFAVRIASLKARMNEDK